MPASPRATAASAEPDRLRPYAFHGVDLAVRGSHAVGDCPFCGREKFSVEVATGLGRCLVCGVGTPTGGGFNGLVFTRLLYEAASNANVGDPGAYRQFLLGVARDRRLLGPDAAGAWGVRQARDGTWLVPGYGADGKLDQVYRRTRVQEKGEWVWRLLPTPGIWPEGKAHALHLPAGDFDPARPDIMVCEGPWDGMALWEARGGGGGNTNVVAVPGCNVWRDEWTTMCRGKRVTLLYDSDHPREYLAGRQSRAGYDGMARVAKRLSGVAASVRYLRWGPDGYDPDRPSGWDVRDHLSTGDTSEADRVPQLADLMTRVEDAPREWFNQAMPVSANGHPRHEKSLEAAPCSSFSQCLEAWERAILMRCDLRDALAVLFALAASTQQAGNQLFLDLIGSPGSAKTTLCRGLLVSGNCIHLENVTKLVSGYKKPGDEGADCSFLARANGKLWVTCEFDVLASSPQYRDLMGKVRRIFDGETTATYGNDDKDKVYSALRTPWVRAGTHKMVDHDQSQLGDRFIRFYIDDPTEEDKRAITKRAIRSERAAMVETANATATSVLDPDTRAAYALTGGYVDWLRANAEEKLAALEISEAVEDYCADLADLGADLRARPTWEDQRRSPPEAHETKELPTRLARQNIRLASCLAVALNKTRVDSEVLRIVRKVALDTASGNSLNIVRWLCSPNLDGSGRLYQESGGLYNAVLTSWTNLSPERLAKYLAFLRKVGVLEMLSHPHTGNSWVLTERSYELYLRVMRG